MPHIGRYEVGEEIGGTDPTVVYAARDPLTGRDVALKAITIPERAPGGAAAFADWASWEAQRVVVGLSHPNLIPVYDAFVDEGRFCLVGERVDGVKLSNQIWPAIIPDRGWSLVVLEGIARAIDYLHGRGVVHGSVTPEQVTLANTGVRLAEPGLAAPSRMPVTALDDADSLLDAMQYLPPEWARGEPLTLATDRYALSMIAYEMLGGMSPFQDDFATALIHSMMHDPPRSLRHQALDAVFARALSPWPAERYETAGAFVQALRDATADDTQSFNIALLADLSRGARTEESRQSALSGVVHRVRTPADVDKLLDQLHPTVLLGDAAANPLVLTVRAWSHFAPDAIADQLRQQGVPESDVASGVARALADATWRATEASWRSLRHLAQSCGNGAREVVVHVFDVAPWTLGRDLTRASDPLQTRTFEKLSLRAGGSVEWRPFSLLLLDEPIASHQASVRALIGLATIAAALHAPVLASAAPGMLAFDDYRDLLHSRFDGIANRMALAELTPLRALQSRPESRFVWLALPRMQTPDTMGDGTPLWWNPAYALAAELASLVRDTGTLGASAEWTARLGTPEVAVAPPMVESLLRERLAYLGARREPPSFFRPDATALDLSLPDTVALSQTALLLRQRWLQESVARGTLSDRMARMNVWLTTWRPRWTGPVPGATLDFTMEAVGPDFAWGTVTVTAPRPGGGSATFATRTPLPHP